MLIYECKAKLLEDGHLEIPEDIKSKLNTDEDMDITIRVKEDISEEQKRQIKMFSQLHGLLSDLTPEDEAKFDEVVSHRLNFPEREI